MLVRAAEAADIPLIHEIYNDVIARTTAIWSEMPMSANDVRVWYDGRRNAGFPVLVAAGGGRVAGFGSYGPFRPRDGYRLTVEHSVHVAEAARGGGGGTALIGRLVDHARAAGLHAMMGGIDGDNAGSIRLHARLGFREVGRLPEVDRKFGRWLDLVLMQKLL